MNNFQFWQSRRADTKIPYLLLLLITIAAVGLGLFHYFTGADAMIPWIKVPQFQPADALIDQFTVAQQVFSIKANGYILTERYDVGLPQINVQAASVFMGLVAICVIFYVSAVSTLKKIPFLAAATLLIFFLVNSNLAGLNDTSPFGQYVAFSILALLILPAYGFQAFFPNVSFSGRLLAFTVLTGIAGFIIFNFSSYSPAITALHFINYSMPGLVIASLLFMGWVAYEIIHVLVWFNTQAKNPARRFGLWQFMLITLLYLGNLALLYMEDAWILKLGLVYLDAFIILFLSAAAGFWGLRKREETYGNLINFWPGAAFLFLVFAAITTNTVGYAFATANDPLIAALNSLIIYTHLGFGIAFFLYVMINYGRLLSQKLQIYKVIYDPKKMGFYTVYILGSLIVGVLLFYTNIFAYRQVKAGYYNLLGDLYQTTGEDLLAQRYYQESDVFEHSNVKANFSLAGISRKKSFRSTEIVYLKEALKRRPDPKTYARLSALFEDKTYFFEQQYILKEGLSKFPQSPMLLNNMALLFNKTSIADSTLFYFNLAENASREKEVIQNNKLAFLIKNGLPAEAETIAKENEKSDYAPLKSNAVYLQHLLGRETPKPVLPAGNTQFTPATFALVYHTILNRIHSGDTSAIPRLDAYIKQKENDAYAEDFRLLKGALQFYNGQPLNARVTLENLSRTSTEGAGYYQDILGQWFLKQEQYRLAAEYFDKAASNKYPDAPLHEAWALAFSGFRNEAKTIAQEQLNAENKDQAQEAKKLWMLVNANLEQAFSLSDSAKVQFIQVQPLSENLEFNGLIASVKNPEIKASAENALLARFLKLNDVSGFQSYFQGIINGSQVSNENLERNRLLSQFWVKTNNLEALKKNLPALNFEPQFQPEKIFYQALLAMEAGQNKEAKKLLDACINKLPYNEDAILTAARFYRDQQKDDLKAYNILMTGITYNPASIKLYQAYVLQSLRSGLDNYALDGLEQLQTLLSAEEYLTFKQLFERELARKQEAAQGWE